MGLYSGVVSTKCERETEILTQAEVLGIDLETLDEVLEDDDLSPGELEELKERLDQDRLARVYWKTPDGLEYSEAHNGCFEVYAIEYPSMSDTHYLEIDPEGAPVRLTRQVGVESSGDGDESQTVSRFDEIVALRTEWNDRFVPHDQRGEDEDVEVARLACDLADILCAWDLIDERPR